MGVKYGNTGDSREKRGVNRYDTHTHARVGLYGLWGLWERQFVTV